MSLSDQNSLKLYVWEDVLKDWTSGLVCVLASSQEQARELINKKYPCAIGS